MNEFWCLVEKVAFHDRFLYFVTILTVKYKLFTAKKNMDIPFSQYCILEFFFSGTSSLCSLVLRS